MMTLQLHYELAEYIRETAEKNVALLADIDKKDAP
jgi:hypothetical protein